MTDTEVEVKLGDENLTLKATLGAAQTVNRLGKSLGGRGLADVLGYIAAGDLDAFAGVIAAGTGTRKADEVLKLQERVYAAGLAKLSDPVTRFVLMLMSGGRDPSSEAPKEGEATGK